MGLISCLEASFDFQPSIFFLPLFSECCICLRKAVFPKCHVSTRLVREYFNDSSRARLVDKILGGGEGGLGGGDVWDSGIVCLKNLRT